MPAIYFLFAGTMANVGERCRRFMSSPDDHASCPQCRMAAGECHLNIESPCNICGGWTFFTEISFNSNFNSVTDNPNNSYDSWDYSRIRQRREGSLSVWLQGDKHNVTPTDKNPSDESHPGDLLTYPPFFREGRRLQVQGASLQKP